nr:hydrogenase maturation nickel metallochaperone HypA [uncultured Cohaesibacter sp.]
MHEASIAMSILRIAVTAMEDQHDAEVDLIRISIGKLKAIEPELLVHSFSALSKGTVCEKARLDYREIPVTVRCRSCEAISEIQRFRFHCAECRGTDLEILTGRELRVEKILAMPVQTRGLSKHVCGSC